MGFVEVASETAFKHTVDAKSIFDDIIKPTKGLV